MKKFFSTFFVLILLMSIFGSVALAADNEVLEEVIAKVNEANQQIQGEIDDAVAEANKAMDEYADDPAKLDAELDMIIDELITNTNRIAKTAIDFAAEKGITVVCEYIEVTIGNRTVLVDPLWVYSD